MATISNETSFRDAIAKLDYNTQRELAAKFAAHVLDLSNDPRVAAGISIAANTQAGEGELAAAFQAVKPAVIESHTRCGSEGDWNAQAAYFVARAAEAALMPEGFKQNGPALQSATSARMARTAWSVENEDVRDSDERKAQYAILNEFLSKRGLS